MRPILKRAGTREHLPAVGSEREAQVCREVGFEIIKNAGGALWRAGKGDGIVNKTRQGEGAAVYAPAVLFPYTASLHRSVGKGKSAGSSGRRAAGEHSAGPIHEPRLEVSDAELELRQSVQNDKRGGHVSGDDGLAVVVDRVGQSLDKLCNSKGQMES